MTRSDRTPQHWLDNPWIALGIGLAVGLLLLVNALEGAAQTLPAGFTAQKPPACTVEKCVGEKGEKGEKGDPGEKGEKGDPGKSAYRYPAPSIAPYDIQGTILRGMVPVAVPRTEYSGTQDLLLFNPATGQVVYFDTVPTPPPQSAAEDVPAEVAALWYVAPCYRVASWLPPRPYTAVQVIRADAQGLELAFVDAAAGVLWIHRWNYQADILSDGCIPLPGWQGPSTYPPS